MPRVKSEAKKAAIVEAATKVFATHGYHAATVQQIADELKMGLGTFYRYFDHKLAVFHAVIEQVFVAVVGRVSAESPTQSTTADEYRTQVERIGLSLFEAFAQNQRLARLLFLEAPGIDDALNEKLREAVTFFGTITQLYLDNGVARGFLRADLDTETTALAVNAMIFEGVRQLSAAKDTEAGRARWAKAVIAMMFDGIRQAPGART